MMYIKLFFVSLFLFPLILISQQSKGVLRLDFDDLVKNSNHVEFVVIESRNQKSDVTFVDTIQIVKDNKKDILLPFGIYTITILNDNYHNLYQPNLVIYENKITFINVLLIDKNQKLKWRRNRFKFFRNRNRK